MFHSAVIQLSNMFFIASLCQLSVFIIFLVLNRKGNWRLNLVLIFIFLLTAVHFTSTYFLIQGGGIKYIPLAHMFIAMFFCVGPLLYFYLRNYFTNRFFHLKSDILHFIIFLFVLALFAFYAISQRGNYSVRPVSIISPVYFHFYVLVYFVLSLMLFIRHRYDPIAERRPVSWPAFLFAGYTSLFFCIFAMYFIWEVCSPSSTYTYKKALLFYTFGPYSIILYFMVFVLFTNALVLFALRGVQIFQRPAKYKYSRLSTEGKIQFEKKIREWIGKDKPYLDPLLSLNDMALSLGISSKDLSQILNECFTYNFADFINSYRVNEAIHLLENDTSNRTILDISFEAGFNAKSTFNLVFKKHTGVSPREYIKNTMRKKSICT